MQISPYLDLELLKHNLTLFKGSDGGFELFLIHRSTQDRVGYSIGYINPLDTSEIACTSYIWTDRSKAIKKLFEVVADEPNLSIKVY